MNTVDHQLAHDLSLRMHALARWIDDHEGMAPLRQAFDGPPHGRAWQTLDATSIEAAASFNRNRIHLCGNHGGLTRDGLADLVQRAARLEIPRLFVWLSPGPGLAEVRQWLGTLSFTRVGWTRYPTLMFEGPTPTLPASRFEIREAGVAAFAAAKTDLGDAVMNGFAHTLGSPGFHHYILYDGSRPIAVAALVKFDGTGYLTYAGTVASDRHRGAQTELIAHRVAVARSLGCTHVLSQTLTMLESSLANLQRCGFREIYEQEVYVLERS